MKKYRELNKIIRRKSSLSSLTLLTLPEPMFIETEQDCNEYFSYLEELSRFLPRVLFLHGSGVEFIE
jgi:hypothetical protein